MKAYDKINKVKALNRREVGIYYDIWADSQTDGEIGFYDECDAVDSIEIEGFFVISEILLITVLMVFACLRYFLREENCK